TPRSTKRSNDCATAPARWLRQRARALIDIAHPHHRERLERSASERFGHQV
ncbi:MAG TPA: hypothetical protein DEG43_03925, partial [Acidimicrobiaceae bacterium]|nr:hypothetical protein [Acidimicrobiaceae bacterium]